jgi:heme-degrading monooxygenase HmoA
MIRHIVMWDVRGGSPRRKTRMWRTLQRSFHSLRGRMPGLLHVEIGVDTSRVDYACDVVLVSEFESQAALDAYATHPEHLRVKQEDRRHAHAPPPGGLRRIQGVRAPP